MDKSLILIEFCIIYGINKFFLKLFVFILKNKYKY